MSELRSRYPTVCVQYPLEYSTSNFRIKSGNFELVSRHIEVLLYDCDPLMILLDPQNSGVDVNNSLGFYVKRFEDIANYKYTGSVYD